MKLKSVKPKRLKRSRRSRSNSNRRGGAVVEAALVIPLIILLTVATLDICDGIYLKKKAVIAAYEGARVAVGSDSSDESIRRAVADYLDSRNINYVDINDVVTIAEDPTVTGDPTTLDKLDPVTVTVEIDLQSNGRLPISVFRRVQGPQIIAKITMLREGD